MIREAIGKLYAGKELSYSQSCTVFEEIFDGQATTAQAASFLTALAFKGESWEDISAAAHVVRAHAEKIQVKRSLAGIEDKEDIVFDCCGTGGGGGLKFNISTAVSLIVAASGVKVAKHGNRAMSSKSGSADCFEALGVKIDVPAVVVQEAIKHINIGFLYAPLYHTALKDVAAIRREIGIKTIFNVVGPLSNPAQATHQLLGVYKKELLPIVARALKALGAARAMVVYSEDLKDEISLSGKNHVAYLCKGKISAMAVTAKSFGLKKIDTAPLKAADAGSSAQIVKQVLSGKSGPARDIVLANAACAFFVLGKAVTLKDGVKLAAQLIDSGAVKHKLTELIKFTKAGHA